MRLVIPNAFFQVRGGKCIGTEESGNFSFNFSFNFRQQLHGVSPQRD